jgi:hypothetical protein
MRRTLGKLGRGWRRSTCIRCPASPSSRITNVDLSAFDYRHGCLLNLYVAVEESQRTEARHWYGQLVHVLEAIADHGALAVLGRGSGRSLTSDALIACG